MAHFLVFICLVDHVSCLELAAFRKHIQENQILYDGSAFLYDGSAFLYDGSAWECGLSPMKW